MSPREILLSILCGAILGLSAPGINLWFLAWIGLVPLFLFISSSNNFIKAFLQGLVFGLSYNMVYLSWYLGLSPLDWLGFNWWQGWLLAGSALFIVSFHQALIIAITAMIISLIPMSASFIPVKKSGSWHLPCFLVIPLVWVVFINKIGNAPDALGVPWSLIEYTQYQQTQIIQAASIIGGIGIGALIVLINVAFASMYATFRARSKFKSIAAKSKGEAVKQFIFCFTILFAFIALGLWDSSKVDVRTDQDIYLLQGNINIEMQKTEKRYKASELLEHYNKLIASTNTGIMIWSESAVPVFLNERFALIEELKAESKNRGQDLVVGAMDRDDEGKPYNAAYGITKEGELLKQIYHKRYLVPFGEYAPDLIYLFPEAVWKLTNTPAGGGFSAGKKPAVLEFKKGKIAPLICFECISPEMVASSTNAGGELLVNVSDLAWFHKSIIGEQMIAFSVFRAIENRRFFAFAANTGPSVVINPRGKITARSTTAKASLTKGRIKYLSEKTIFSKWFR